MEGFPHSVVLRASVSVMDGGESTMRTFAEFLNNDEAATAVEYSVMLALILLVALSAIASVGVKTSGLWDNIVSGMRTFGM
jgi:Flp pilus assembly pilin Flp